MWFNGKLTKEKASGIARITVCGMRFKIKKINPLLDFQEGNMPQIFTSYAGKRGTAKSNDPREALKQMMLVVERGVVEPKLVPVGEGEARGKESDLTVEDLFRDMDMGHRLYFEILAHSLNKFSGLKGVFFSALLKRKLFIQSRKAAENPQ